MTNDCMTLTNALTTIYIITIENNVIRQFQSHEMTLRETNKQHNDQAEILTRLGVVLYYCWTSVTSRGPIRTRLGVVFYYCWTSETPRGPILQVRGNWKQKII